MIVTGKSKKKEKEGFINPIDDGDEYDDNEFYTRTEEDDDVYL